jgi:Spy/CpxP family protein refolding chaperone
MLMRSKLFTFALGGALTLGVSGAAFAQEPPPPPPDQAQGGPGPGGGMHHMDPNKQLEHMTKALDLTADQQSQIKPVLMDRQQKLQALFENQSLSQDDRRTQARSVVEESNTKIESVLNDQQKQKFAAMQQRMRHGGPGGPPPGEAPPPPQN